MTLSEAIKIVTHSIQPHELGVSPNFLAALKLLLKAGEFITENRGLGAGNVPWLLPGETPATKPHGGLPLGGITIVEKGIIK